MGVSIRPGMMALQRMRWRALAAATVVVSLLTPALEIS